MAILPGADQMISGVEVPAKPTVTIVNIQELPKIAAPAEKTTQEILLIAAQYIAEAEKLLKNSGVTPIEAAPPPGPPKLSIEDY